MKATLEFNLPDDEFHHNNAVAADRLVSALTDMDGWLRDKVKYGTENTEVYDKVREALYDIMRDNLVAHLVLDI